MGAKRTKPVANTLANGVFAGGFVPTSLANQVVEPCWQRRRPRKLLSPLAAANHNETFLGRSHGVRTLMAAAALRRSPGLKKSSQTKERIER
jgi:hypothetical protein